MTDQSRTPRTNAQEIHTIIGVDGQPHKCCIPYVTAKFARTLELEAADLRSENNQLRRLIEKGRDSNATELGLSAQVDMYRDGAAKLLTQAEEANATIKDLRERLAKFQETLLPASTQAVWRCKRTAI